MQRTIDGEQRAPLFTRLDPAVARPVPGVELHPRGAQRKASNRATVIALTVLVAVQAVVALIWISATHDPKAHRVPLAIAAGATSTATQLTVALNGIGTHPVAATAMTTQAADDALHTRKVDAVLVVGTGGTDTLYVANAAGQQEAQLLSATLGALDTGQNRKLQTVDAIPLPAGDSTGLTPFCLVLSWIAAGILGALTIASLAGRTAPTRNEALRRIAHLAGFALACSFITTVAADLFYGVTEHAIAGTVVAGLAVTFATATATSALRAITGPTRTFAALIAFLAVGVPSAGALVPHHLLPAALRAIGPHLITGAGTELTNDVLNFGRHGIAGPLATLAVWTATGVGLCIVSTTRAQRQHGATNNL